MELAMQILVSIVVMIKFISIFGPGNDDLLGAGIFMIVAIYMGIWFFPDVTYLCLLSLAIVSTLTAQFQNQ